VGPKPRQTPVIVAELASGNPGSVLVQELREVAQRHSQTSGIERFLFYRRSLPVDVRHNTKINREQLAEWAGRQ
jgi:hypothetical protein